MCKNRGLFVSQPEQIIESEGQSFRVYMVLVGAARLLGRPRVLVRCSCPFSPGDTIHWYESWILIIPSSQCLP